MRVRSTAALLLGVVLAATACSSSPAPSVSPSPSPTPVDAGGRAPNTPFDVTPADFGIHSYTTKPEVPTGTIRLACSPTWSVVQPAKGQFDWTDMDARVARAEGWGYSDILFSFCGTPPWAGTPVKGEDLAVLGAKTAQPPRDLADWEAYVRAVVTRYRGRISGYEVWNEPTSPQFFTGTPRQMADMSRIATNVVHEVDPDAYVLSGSLQTHRQDFYRGFALPYLRALAAADWPVDGIAAHFYTSGDGTPANRVQQIAAVQADLRRLRAPADLPLWDTEVNYHVSLPGGSPDGRITGNRAAAWTARTFMDSWRTGIRRTYWYLWTAEYYDFPGIQMRTGDPSTLALNALGTWLIGSRFQGCREARGAVTCSFTGRDSTFRVAWAQRRGVEVPLQGTQQVCPVTGAPCQDKSGTLPLTEVPVRIQ